MLSGGGGGAEEMHVPVLAKKVRHGGRGLTMHTTSDVHEQEEGTRRHQQVHHATGAAHGAPHTGDSAETTPHSLDGLISEQEGFSFNREGNEGGEEEEGLPEFKEQVSAETRRASRLKV
ncbi:unnamed protein product [Pleuronectes platessa]|uniref:Uncharacterized protein n=1 Tax=Pleuronectes platessa TaxID=8262 RepID=A0A9N7TU28_PLEPL|nr:unnamed protein product [Pleuronectes platessa]